MLPTFKDCVAFLRAGCGQHCDRAIAGCRVENETFSVSCPRHELARSQEQQAHHCWSPLFLRQQKVERGPDEFIHWSAITDQLRPCGRTLVTVDKVAGECI